MSKSKRPEAVVDAVRKNIMEVSASMINEEGYDKFSVRKLANKIGCTTGTIYSNFENKEDIILGIIEDNNSVWRDKMLSLNLYSMEPKAALKAVIVETIYYHLQRKELVRTTMITGHVFGVSDELPDSIKECFFLIHELVRSSLSATASDSIIYLQFSFMIHAINGMIMEKVASEEVVDKKIIELYADTILYGMLRH